MIDSLAAGADPLAQLHNVESVMDRLSIRRSAVFSLIGNGELRSIKLGKRRLVSESALREFIERIDAPGVSD
jgi:excisionase family DNA binding protein